MSDQQPDPVEEKIHEQIKLLSYAFATPEALAKAVGEWLTDNYPARVSAAYWITFDTKQRDSGIQYTINKRSFRFKEKLAFNANLLLGKISAGASLSTQVWQNARGWSVHLGLGATTPYDHVGEWHPTGTFSVRIPLA